MFYTSLSKLVLLLLFTLGLYLIFLKSWHYLEFLAFLKSDTGCSVHILSFLFCYLCIYSVAVGEGLIIFYTLYFYAPNILHLTLLAHFKYFIF